MPFALHLELAIVHTHSKLELEIRGYETSNAVVNSWHLSSK